MVTMGTVYRFVCSQCDFSAAVSGGFDIGAASASQTYACWDCGVLFDRYVSNTPEVDHRVAPQTMHCGKDPRHTAILWNHPGPCPRCEKTLRKKELVVCWE